MELRMVQPSVLPWGLQMEIPSVLRLVQRMGRPLEHPKDLLLVRLWVPSLVLLLELPMVKRWVMLWERWSGRK